MAGTSPRRSIRSRTSQPNNTSSHHSSASSNSSSRADRNTRTSAKAESPPKTSRSGSLSSEPPEESVAAVEEALQTRRSKRGQTEDQDKISNDNTTDMTNGLEEEEDEAVRCICGFEEYPGPPQISEEDSKKGIKDLNDMELITAADYTDDLAGFFLQCDTCKVWQHGGCVGIKNEDMSPDEYFCEECRKDLHRIFTASNGQKYSHYLPLYQTLSRTTSRAASFSKDGTRSPRGSNKNGRQSAASGSSKRRSTMNSRDAAYDEEEQLRRAIEASKSEKVAESLDSGSRRAKRGRSDSEEKIESSKRQRTMSNSPSPVNDVAQFASNDSDDGSNNRNGGSKKIRGAAARNQKEKEAREEKERLRQEAANKRKGRADRRRQDDSDPSDDLPIKERTGSTNAVDKITKDTPNPDIEPPPSSQPAADDDDPPAAQVSSSSTSHKKGGRPPASSRKGKLGKNQYTRDRDTGAESGAGDDNNSPGGRSQSRDASRDENGSGGGGSHEKHHGHHLHHHRNVHSESRGHRKGAGHGHSGGKVTMSDMKKRVAAMLEFIQRTQLEMAEMAEMAKVVGMDLGGMGNGNGNGTGSGGSAGEPPGNEGIKEVMRGLAEGLLPALRAQEGEEKEKQKELDKKGDVDVDADAPAPTIEEGDIAISSNNATTNSSEKAEDPTAAASNDSTNPENAQDHPPNEPNNDLNPDPEKDEPEGKINDKEKDTSTSTPTAATAFALSGKEFKELSLLQMMDVLTTELVKWQNRFT